MASQSLGFTSGGVFGWIFGAMPNYATADYHHLVKITLLIYKPLALPLAIAPVAAILASAPAFGQPACQGTV